MSRPKDDENLLTYAAVDESGAVVGYLRVWLDDNGGAPQVVRDRHGTTWLLEGYTDERTPDHLGRYAAYRRTRCGEAHLHVKEER